MASVSIVGTGSMGQAIAGLAEKGSSSVQTLGRGDSDTSITGDIAILAVPYSALSEVLEQRSEQLAGKVVVDITNPIDSETFELAVPADSSAAAELQGSLPDSRVLKAFNTNFASTLSSGEIGGQRTAVLIAGDDAEAKSQLAEVVSAGGLRAIDAGPLRRSRELEALGFLQITLAAGEKIPWTGGFAVLG